MRPAELMLTDTQLGWVGVPKSSLLALIQSVLNCAVRDVGETCTVLLHKNSHVLLREVQIIPLNSLYLSVIKSTLYTNPTNKQPNTSPCRKDNSPKS